MKCSALLGAKAPLFHSFALPLFVLRGEEPVNGSPQLLLGCCPIFKSTVFISGFGGGIGSPLP
jgi:hypothetical protein